MRNIARILVPTDLSELSLEALDYATALGKTWNAKVYLLHVIDILPNVSVPALEYPTENILQDYLGETERTVAAIARERSSAEMGLVPVVRQGIAHREIVRFVREQGIDLVILSSHGRTGITHFLLGSIAEKVVHSSPVPVLTIKHPRPGSSTTNAELAHEMPMNDSTQN